MNGSQLLYFFQSCGVSLYADGEKLSTERALHYLEMAARLPEIFKIPLDSIMATESNFRAPRELFDRSMGDLAVSLAERGIQVPIKVRRLASKIVPEVGNHMVNAMVASGIPVPVKCAEQFILVHGFRRLVAARCLGWKEIDAEILQEK